MIKQNIKLCSSEKVIKITLTQRISSGLKVSLHLSDSSNIFFDFSTFQFRASKYLLRHPSLQYFKLRPESGPRASLSSLTWLRKNALFSLRSHIVIKKKKKRLLQKHIGFRYDTLISYSLVFVAMTLPLPPFRQTHQWGGSANVFSEETSCCQAEKLNL